MHHCRTGGRLMKNQLAVREVDDGAGCEEEIAAEEADGVRRITCGKHHEIVGAILDAADAADADGRALGNATYQVGAVGGVIPLAHGFPGIRDGTCLSWKKTGRAGTRIEQEQAVVAIHGAADGNGAARENERHPHGFSRPDVHWGQQQTDTEEGEHANHAEMIDSVRMAQDRCGHPWL